jgi:uroporphyrinogen-III synthase
VSGLVLVLRPEPGASATAARARALGLEAISVPLFTVRPVDWKPPDPAGLDALLLTSAHAARHAGPRIGAFLTLPCHAVGEATAAAAAQAGFGDVRTGPGDGAAALASTGAGRILHLCGRDHLPLERAGIEVVRRIVYAADPASTLPPQARDALREGALALIHSPRAGALLAALVVQAGLVRAAIPIAAISADAAAAAGPGWRSVSAAPRPRDEALLELAAQLCQTGRRVSE